MEPKQEDARHPEGQEMSEENIKERRTALLWSAEEARRELLFLISEMEQEADELEFRMLLPLSEEELDIRKEMLARLDEMFEEVKLAERKFLEALEDLTGKRY